MKIHRPEADLDSLRDLAAPCRLCEHRCGVDRLAGELGRCGVGAQARYYNAFVHLGEEPELTPCYTVFLSGCSFRCPYCSDADWVVQPGRGRPLQPDVLAATLAAKQGLRSVELVGGEATVSLHHAAELAVRVPRELPVVLNTNGWLTREAMALLPPLVDLLLLDVKHATDGCARELTGQPLTGYLDHLGEVLQAARRTLRRGCWVRHLVLPGHRDCCTGPVLRWLAAEAPGTYVNLLTQYRPLHEARRHPGIDRQLSREEKAGLPDWLRGLDLPLDLHLDGRPLGGATARP
ncbi:MAG: radical SAM protein [Myxococcota bacterium]|jgi:putative pyruvate formate lyase activating enzyme|nr:radical SAM protein [Myxococcota bacterium]